MQNSEDTRLMGTLFKWKKQNPYFGRRFSILGDSISTLEGFNPPGYRLFYTKENARQTNVYNRADTWWGKVIDFFGGELLVNNSWSGSRVTTIRESMQDIQRNYSNAARW